MAGTNYSIQRQLRYVHDRKRSATTALGREALADGVCRRLTRHLRTLHSHRRLSDSHTTNRRRAALCHHPRLLNNDFRHLPLPARVQKLASIPVDGSGGRVGRIRDDHVGHILV